MKFLNYVPVALATLPTCAGQGSLRVASQLVPPEDDLETRARAHLDVLFDDTRRDVAGRRRLHRLAVDSEKETWEKEREDWKNDLFSKKDLQKYKDQATALAAMSGAAVLVSYSRGVMPFYHPESANK